MTSSSNSPTNSLNYFHELYKLTPNKTTKRILDKQVLIFVKDLSITKRNHDNLISEAMIKYNKQDLLKINNLQGYLYKVINNTYKNQQKKRKKDNENQRKYSYEATYTTIENEDTRHIDSFEDEQNASHSEQNKISSDDETIYWYLSISQAFNSEKSNSPRYSIAKETITALNTSLNFYRKLNQFKEKKQRTKVSKLKGILTLDEDFSSYYKKADIHYNNRKWEKNIEERRKCIREQIVLMLNKNEYSQPIYRCGFLLMNTGEYDIALFLFDKLIDMLNNNAIIPPPIVSLEKELSNKEILSNCQTQKREIFENLYCIDGNDKHLQKAVEYAQKALKNNPSMNAAIANQIIMFDVQKEENKAKNLIDLHHNNHKLKEILNKHLSKQDSINIEKEHKALLIEKSSKMTDYKINQKVSFIDKKKKFNQMTFLKEKSWFKKFLTT